MTKSNDWMLGYAAAVGALAHTFNMPSLAYEVIKADGLTVEMLKAGGAEDTLGMDRLEDQETKDTKRKARR